MLNVNIGVLGHVDSGKTSLSKVLSTVSSTAAFDKNPQSIERGMTLDLGFSAFTVDVMDQPQFASRHIHTLQVTLVDCPGHASLIRTVIGGAQIVDFLVVVVDATKGIQTQTAECLVVGEVIGKPLLVALNKIDAVQGSSEEDRQETLKKMKRRLERTLLTTRWPGTPIVEVAADPGARGLHTTEVAEAMQPVGIQALIDAMVGIINVEALFEAREAARQRRDGFIMFVDHCFPVKGQGTVLTGTVMQGQIAVGEDLVLPDYQLTRRVKSIQVFRKSVPLAKQGDRIGICIAQFDAKDMERGIACSANAAVVSTSTLIATVHKVRFHTRAVDAGQKFHISIGHMTVMGTMRFFASSHQGAARAAKNDGDGNPKHVAMASTEFDFAGEYQHLDALPEASALVYDTTSVTVAGHPAKAQHCATSYYAVVLLERPVTTVLGATLIASHLDADVHINSCRLAVMGSVMCTSGLEAPDAWRSIHAVKYKQKRVSIDRVIDPRTCIAKGLVQPKEGLDMKLAGAQMFADVQRFVGMQVHAMWPRKKEGAEGASADPEVAIAEGVRMRGEGMPPPSDAVVGKIESAFGKTGKVRLVFSQDVFVVPPAKSGGRGGRGGRGRKPPPKGASDDAPRSPKDGDAEDVVELNAEAAEEGTSPNAPPRVRLYFFFKKFPFAQHCPLQQ
jgi:selenocysteine-specific elongation factor